MCGCPFRWALGPRQVASNRLEACFGAYSGRVLDEWVPSDDNEVENAGARLPDVPNVWTDGSLVREEVSEVLVKMRSSLAGATGAECCWLYCSVLGSLQTVQRAEIWGVIFCAAELQGCPSGCGQPERCS